MAIYGRGTKINHANNTKTKESFPEMRPRYSPVFIHAPIQIFLLSPGLYFTIHSRRLYSPAPNSALHPSLSQSSTL